MSTPHPLVVHIVDDDAGVRDSLEILLRLHGYRAVGFASGETFLEALDGSPARPGGVVLLDLRLPGMDGVTATRELQTRAPDTKVMILSAYTRQHDVDEAWAAGVHGYVTKMQDAGELRAAIEKVAAGERYLSPGLKPSQKADRSGPLGMLSARERDVFRLLVRGLTTREIASELTISGKTVDTHRERILKKLDLHSAVELVRYAATNNVLDV